jgi:hypothetical protein
MNWPLFWQLLVTAVVAFSGAWLAHILAGSRDRKNKRRDQRIAFLIEAYRRLEFVANRQSINDCKPIESAIADIQLFGSPSQVRLAQEFVIEFAANQSAPLDTILSELRKDLRAEISLRQFRKNCYFYVGQQTRRTVVTNVGSRSCLSTSAHELRSPRGIKMR